MTEQPDEDILTEAPEFLHEELESELLDNPGRQRRLQQRDWLPGMPRDANGPVFREPWEAQAFAMAVRLHEQGVFTWTEWAAALAAEIEAAQAAGDPDTGETYYRHWLAALEKLAAAKGMVGPDELAGRRNDWAEAYARTPHGQPVTLDR